MFGLSLLQMEWEGEGPARENMGTAARAPADGSTPSAAGNVRAAVRLGPDPDSVQHASIHRHVVSALTQFAHDFA